MKITISEKSVDDENGYGFDNSSTIVLSCAASDQEIRDALIEAACRVETNSVVSHRKRKFFLRFLKSVCFAY